MFSTIINRMHRLCRLSGLALVLALALCLLTPQTSKAYAFLLRSDPASNAVLKAEPAQVRLWFSEDLNPDNSTASVVNSANQRVDVNGGLVLPTNARKMDIALRPDLLPGVYVVTWHTQSANDGQVFSGAFPFSIANTNGSVPAPAKPLPDQSQLAGSPGQIDSVVIFRWLMAALVDLCVIFWVSGKVWHSFVLDPAVAETAQQRAIAQLSQQRFALRYSLPILRVLFLANIGVLAGQALVLTAGRWDLIFAPTLLVGLLTNGNFGVFWLTGEVVTALAIMLETIVLFSRQHTTDSTSNDTSAWLDVLLGLLLLIVTTLISYTTASGITPGVLPILIGGLHLLAATLWIGGICYLALVYEPILQRDRLPVGPQPLRVPTNSREETPDESYLKGHGPTDEHDRPASENALALLTILQRFSPLAMSAAVIMILSGTYNAIVNRTSFDQFQAAVFEPVLMIEIVPVLVLLIASAWLFFLLQPALTRDLTAGTHKQDSVEAQEPEVIAKVQEQSIMRHVNRLSIVLRYMLLLGVIVILCMGLMSVLVGGL